MGKEVLQNNRGDLILLRESAYILEYKCKFSRKAFVRGNKCKIEAETRGGEMTEWEMRHRQLPVRFKNHYQNIIGKIEIKKNTRDMPEEDVERGC